MDRIELFFAGLFNGLLLSAVVAGPASEIQRSQRNAESEHQDVGGHLEAGHLLLQRQKVLRAHHHPAQQTAAHQARRQHPLLRQVSYFVTHNNAKLST